MVKRQNAYGKPYQKFPLRSLRGFNILYAYSKNYSSEGYLWDNTSLTIKILLGSHPI